MNLRIKPKPINALLLAVIVSAFSCKTLTLSEYAVSNIDSTLTSFASDEALRSASWGFYAVDAASGQILASHNPHLGLAPASTQKLVTTITALSVLGADFRFQTKLQYIGSIENGVLNGDLIIKGTGDPSLGSKALHDSLSLENVLEFWHKALTGAGIRRIDGKIVADGSWFDDHMIPPKWMWEDMGNYFGAGAHAITVNENLYSVFFRPGQRENDASTVIRTEPFVPGMTFHNQVLTGPRGSGDQVFIYGAPYTNHRWLTGTVPMGVSSFEVKGSLPDPGYFLAATLKNYLNSKGIQNPAEPVTHRNYQQLPAEGDRKMLATWHSPRLVDIATRTNFNSVNTFAENLFKTLGKKLANDGSFSASAKAITQFWTDKGIDTRGLRIHDGSGLSSFNNLTVQQLAEILQFASGDTLLYHTLIKGLPVAARTGNLARMFANTPSAGILMAKSGSLANVRGYAGYTVNRAGRLIAFAFIVNNFDGPHAEMRRKMEAVMNEITRSE